MQAAYFSSAVLQKCHKALSYQCEARRGNTSSCISSVALEHVPGKPLLHQLNSAGYSEGGGEGQNRREGKTGQREGVLRVGWLERGEGSGYSVPGPVPIR